MPEPIPSVDVVRTIADELPIGLWVAKAPTGELIYANRAFREILGMPARSDVAAGEYAATYSILRRGGGAYPESELPFARALASRKTEVVEDLVLKRPDGSRVHVRAFAQPMFEPGGEVHSISVSFIDITREVEAEEARNKSEELLRRVINGAPVILFSYDQKGVITLSEGSGLKGLGLKPGQLVGQSIFEVLKDDPEAARVCRRALTGEVFSTRTVYAGVAYDATYTPLLDAAGAVVGAVGIALDITEQQKMQRQLVAADRMAAVGTLAAGVAHEINNPLTFVIASLELAERHLPAPGAGGEAARVHLSAAREGIARVARIARDLFTFSRDAGDRRVPIRLRSAVEAAVRLSSSQTSAVAQVVEVHGTAPMVLADEGRLAQVLLNLLINAAHAIDAGGKGQGEIRITTGTDASGFAFIELSDNGVGISPELLLAVFDPFVTTKPVGMGTGLGLSVSKSIVEGYGGTLTVDSALGKGTTFKLRLPPAPQGTKEAPTGPVGAPKKQRLRVLIIDDDSNLCLAFRAVLEPEHEVRVCLRGEDALKALLSDEQFDVVLCDVMLQDLQARAVYERLAAERPGRERELVFITGGAYMRDAREFLASVNNLRYEKPFEVEQVIADVLRRRSAAGR